MFAAIRAKLVHLDTDSVAVRNVKILLAADMSTRYQDTDISLLLNKASFLDPRFKTLAHLSTVEQEETVDNIIQDLLSNVYVECISNRGDEFKIVELEAEPEEEAAVVEYCTSPKKQKITLLEKLLGKKFESTPSTVAVSENEIVQAEISYYKNASPISLRDKPLDWWNKRKHLLPNLAKLAKSIWAL